MYEKELKAMIQAAKDAEKKILEIYHTDFAVEIKSDDSPVTKADKTADQIIRDILGKAFPTYGMLTEESIDDKSRLEKEYVFIVDPVDGTKEFVSRNGEFATNIALARDHEVVVGVINIPVYHTLFYAVKGQGSYRMNPDGSIEQIHVSDRDTDLICMASRSFGNPQEEAIAKRNSDKITKTEVYGAALKFCRLAEGKADIFFRVSPSTKEWDVAAGDIIVTEAGGVMRLPNKETMRYNREDVYNRDGYYIMNKLSNWPR